MTRTVPFTPLEEAVFHLERTSVPWNVHLEVETGARLDLERLRAAAATACGTHPLARARRRPHDGWDSRYVWELADEVDRDAIPVRAVEVEDRADVRSVRTAFYGEPFDLTDGPPPFRLLVVRGAGVDGGDRLLVAASHVPIDGVGAMRLLRSICRAYRGEPLDPDPVDLEASREVLDDARPSRVSDRVGLVGKAATRLGNTVDRPARVAPEGAGDEVGWGFVHRRVDEDLAARLIEERPPGASVNDVLLAALHLTIDRWNRERGDPPGKISLMMPVNLRPREWFHEVVGMYATFESVTTRADHRADPRRTVERVADQTSDLKERSRAAALVESLELIPPATPVGLKQRLPHLLRGPGRGLLDTAMLSNLGRVPEPLPALSGEAPEALWFSPPAWLPTPVGVGVATVDGTVHLSFRYLFTTFDREAAEAFADRYLERLAATVRASATGAGRTEE